MPEKQIRAKEEVLEKLQKEVFQIRAEKAHVKEQYKINLIELETVFDNNEISVCLKVEGKSDLSRKEIDKITDWVKRPQIGAGGLAYLRIQEDGSYKSSVDKFLFGTYDLIVSNPPYINKLNLKYLEEDVKNFDPEISLNGGKEGLEIIKSVIFYAKKLCKYNGKLILEIDPIQKKRVINILKKNNGNRQKWEPYYRGKIWI